MCPFDKRFNTLSRRRRIIRMGEVPRLGLAGDLLPRVLEQHHAERLDLARLDPAPHGAFGPRETISRWFGNVQLRCPGFACPAT